jgi:hypothetical protein
VKTNSPLRAGTPRGLEHGLELSKMDESGRADDHVISGGMLRKEFHQIAFMQPIIGA